MLFIIWASYCIILPCPFIRFSDTELNLWIMVFYDTVYLFPISLDSGKFPAIWQWIWKHRKNSRLVYWTRGKIAVDKGARKPHVRYKIAYKSSFVHTLWHKTGSNCIRVTGTWFSCSDYIFSMPSLIMARGFTWKLHSSRHVW